MTESWRNGLFIIDDHRRLPLEAVDNDGIEHGHGVQIKAVEQMVLMARLWRQRVAVLTYRKRPGDEWPVTEFASYEVRLVGGELVTMLLAERGVFLGGVIWVREIRRLTTTGHQTAIVTTHYEWDLMNVESTIFARWCQENFFAYMRRHYGLDHLISYVVARSAAHSAAPVCSGRNATPLFGEKGEYGIFPGWQPHQHVGSAWRSSVLIATVSNIAL